MFHEFKFSGNTFPSLISWNKWVDLKYIELCVLPGAPKAVDINQYLASTNSSNTTE